MTKNNIPAGFSLIDAKKEDSQTAQQIIFAVLDEYGFSPELGGSDADLVDVATYYSGGYFGLIINDLNESVGAFGLHPLKDKTCKIRKMYLLPEARGNGLGKWMLAFMIAKARSLGFSRIELETATRLNHAVDLYRSFGFKQLISENATPECDLVFYMNLS